MTEITVTANTLDGLRKAIERIAAKISAPSNLLPSYGSSKDFAHPHLEIDSRGLHFVVVERGQELERKTTNDPNELLFWVFECLTSEMSYNYELQNRNDELDSRRIAFKKRLELLDMIDSSWKQRVKEAQRNILREHPFDDYSGIRARLTKELRDNGESPEVAWKKACDKYPLPR